MITVCSSASRTLQPSQTVSGITNAGGLIGLTTPVHHFASGDVVSIIATGTAGADGSHVINVIDSTHVALQNTAYSGAGSNSGLVSHIGYVAGSITSPAMALVTLLNAKLDALSAVTVCRLIFEDSADSGFVSAQPLIVLQSLAGQGPGFDGQFLTQSAPAALLADIRQYLRLKVLLLNAPFFSSITVSSWIS
jgi:hypothetical protein